jgi:hypothetical protein
MAARHFLSSTHQQIVEIKSGFIKSRRTDWDYSHTKRDRRWAERLVDAKWVRSPTQQTNTNKPQHSISAQLTYLLSYLERGHKYT